MMGLIQSLALQSLVAFLLFLICLYIIIEQFCECLVYSFLTFLKGAGQIFYLLVRQTNLQLLGFWPFEANSQGHYQNNNKELTFHKDIIHRRQTETQEQYLYSLILNIFDQVHQQPSPSKMQCPTHVKKLQKISEAKSDPCEICGRTAFYECKLCSFVQCEQCRICNKRHGLIKIIELSKVKPEYYNNGYSCNSCSKSKNVDDDGIWHCSTCNYDLCPDCAE